MNNMDVSFSHGRYSIIFEDDSLYHDFLAVFEASLSDNSDGIAFEIKITGTDEGGYSIYHNSQLVHLDFTKTQAAYYLTRIIGNGICFGIDSITGVMHAAGVYFDGGAVSFMGTSGSGKTSISLVFAAYGRFIGDEYAFIDLDEGYYWHENHPFQLKAQNHQLLEWFDSEPRLLVEAESFGQAYYFPVSATDYIKSSREDRIKLKTIIFPCYDKSAESTAIKKMAADKLPVAILESLFGMGQPSLLLKRFLHICAKNKIRLYEVEFSDCLAAAKELDGFLNSEKEVI